MYNSVIIHSSLTFRFSSSSWLSLTNLPVSDMWINGRRTGTMWRIGMYWEGRKCHLTCPRTFLGILCISNLPQLKWISHEVIWKKLENIFVVWKLSQQQTDPVAEEVFILTEENLSYSGKTRPNYLLFSHNDQQRIVGSKVASGFVLLCFCKFCVFFLPESWQEHLIGREDSCASVDNICEN